MHKQFFRLFISIVLIVLVSITFQLGCITLFSRSLVYVWSSQVFDEFAENVEDSLENADFTGTKSIYDFVFSNVSERISGFILRSSVDGQMLTFGQSGKGKIMPQLSSFVNNTFTYMQHVSSTTALAESNGKVLEINAPKYRIDITIPNPFGLEVTDAVFSRTDYTGKVSVTYPQTITRADVAGTFEIYINGNLSAYLDVLVYSVDYYTPTKFILREVYKVLGYSVPIALVLAFILAYVLSRKTERKVKEVEDALSKLSEGQFDITMPPSKIEEYQKMGDSIEALGRDLRRHSASRKEWIRNISHDLNTPVTSMNMLLEGIQDGMFPLNDETIKLLKKENDTLMSRIASVSYYSYLLSPDAKCEKRKLNLLSEATNTALSAKAEVDIRVEEDASIYADEKLLSRAFLEVLKNAIEYGIGCDKPIWKATATDEYMVVTISNHGHLPDPLPQFFEPWARGDASRTQGGSGLGLSIVYQIMELHGGKVSIREENGEVFVDMSFPFFDYVSVV
ncbi:MAG: HAMP domain-containing histidine kinase [Spirochaetales bacterium]|nr:HAMP domain-containing histidine kinase [Spirochaetales bacterium]